VDTTASPEVLASSAASLGLTRREVEVLALGVAGRGQAAAIAHRLGLDKR
jgi:DNA-binding CsgD family transcriptional regulator